MSVESPSGILRMRGLPREVSARGSGKFFRASVTTNNSSPWWRPVVPQETRDGDRPEPGRLALSGEERTYPTRIAGISILIVDDISANADSLRELLQLEGGVVDVALRAADALQCLSCKRYDVVISDLAMPGMGGHELVAAMRASGPNARTPAIAYSGYSSADVPRGPREPRFDLYLVKPAGLDAFVEAILTLAGRDTAY